MKKISLLVLISTSLLLSACGPYVHYFNVDVKQPSKTQINFERPFSVIAETPDNLTDSTFLSNIGIGIAENLEEENNLEEHQIQVFSVKDVNVDLDNRSDLIYLSSQSNSELMMLIDNYKSYGFSVFQKDLQADNLENYIETTVLMPYKSRIRIYDVVKDTMVYQEARLDTLSWTILGQNKIDKIKALQLIQSKIPLVCKTVGSKVIKDMIPKWKTESRELYFYNSKGLWYEALLYANDFQWEKAMDIWMKYTESKDIIQASCASYNMALACEITQQYDIAIEWLDLSDSYYKLSESKNLRQLILKEKSLLKEITIN